MNYCREHLGTLSKAVKPTKIEFASSSPPPRGNILVLKLTAKKRLIECVRTIRRESVDEEIEC